MDNTSDMPEALPAPTGSGFPWDLEAGAYVIMRYASGPHTAQVLGRRTLKNERPELRIIDIECYVDGGYPRAVTESSWHLLYRNTPEDFGTAKKDAREAWLVYRAEMDIQNGGIQRSVGGDS